MSENEIDLSLNNCRPLLENAVIDHFSYDEKALQIHFSKNKKNLSLLISLKPGNPYFFVSEQNTRPVKALKKPLALFLKTHFQGLKVKEIRRDLVKGRCLIIEFYDFVGEMRISLIPGSANIEVQKENKLVFAYKPRKITTHQKKESLAQARDNEFFRELWQSQAKSVTQATVDIEKILAKKISGLEKMQLKLNEMNETSWSSAGEWLKVHSHYDEVPLEFKELIDPAKSLSWNLENCFEKAKKNKSKIEGTLQRIKQLEEEIQRLKNGKTQAPSASKGSSSPKITNLHKHSQSQGRTIDLGQYRLYIGRSGEDNLRLLRKAKAWYIWLHIKDYPGAHGILERPRSSVPIEIEVIKKAALAVIKQSVSSEKSGVFDAIYAECRYVRPVRGAKAGQVTLSHEKVVSVRI